MKSFKHLAATLAAVFLATTSFAKPGPTPAGVPKDYPLKTCVVSGETLGEHGKVAKVTHEGSDVYLCCNACKKDFNKDPEKFVKAVKKQLPKSNA